MTIRCDQITTLGEYWDILVSEAKDRYSSGGERIITMNTNTPVAYQDESWWGWLSLITAAQRAEAADAQSNLRVHGVTLARSGELGGPNSLPESHRRPEAPAVA